MSRLPVDVSPFVIQSGQATIIVASKFSDGKYEESIQAIDQQIKDAAKQGFFSITVLTDPYWDNHIIPPYVYALADVFRRRGFRLTFNAESVEAELSTDDGALIITDEDDSILVINGEGFLTIEWSNPDFGITEQRSVDTPELDKIDELGEGFLAYQVYLQQTAGHNLKYLTSIILAKNIEHEIYAQQKKGVIEFIYAGPDEVFRKVPAIVLSKLFHDLTPSMAKNGYDTEFVESQGFKVKAKI